jgi:organic radical activating enzyme
VGVLGPAILPEIPPLEVRDGLLWTEAVEINAAWHCNIRCASCSHGSPEMPTLFADAAQVLMDLSSLSRWMRTDHIRLVGGEPLIHPNVMEIIKAVHDSGLSTQSRIITNGLALLDQPLAFWEIISEVHVSVYPNTKRFHERHRSAIVKIAQETGTTLVYKTFDNFRKSFRPVSHDDQLTEAIYRTCQIANRWRCLTAESGYIYRCPQSVLPALESSVRRDSDRLTISDIGSSAMLRDWITSSLPLDACRGCTGSVGQLHPHRQLCRDESSSILGDIDFAYLSELVRDPDMSNGCVVGEEELA